MLQGPPKTKLVYRVDPTDQDNSTFRPFLLWKKHAQPFFEMILFRNCTSIWAAHQKKMIHHHSCHTNSFRKAGPVRKFNFSPVVPTSTLKIGSYACLFKTLSLWILVAKKLIWKVVFWKNGKSLMDTVVGFEANVKIENANKKIKFTDFKTLWQLKRSRKWEKSCIVVRTSSSTSTSSSASRWSTTTTTATDFRSKVKRALHGTILKSARRFRAPGSESQSWRASRKKVTKSFFIKRSSLEGQKWSKKCPAPVRATADDEKFAKKRHWLQSSDG